MQALMQSIPAKSFDASAATASTGTAYALLPQAQQVQWTTSFGTDPDAVSIAIQTSLDNSVWTTIVTTTTVGGTSNYFQTSAVFIRAKINSITNGAEVTVNLVAKVGIVGLVTPSSVTDGSLVIYSGTTGSKFSELVFDGNPLHALLGDGTFGDIGGGIDPNDLITIAGLAIGDATPLADSITFGSGGGLITRDSGDIILSTTNGGDIIIQPSGGSLIVNGQVLSGITDTNFQFIIASRPGLSGDQHGQELTLQGGNGFGDGHGGDIFLQTGRDSTTAIRGAELDLLGGNDGGVGIGGLARLFGGDSTGVGSLGGNVLIYPGTGETGGSVIFRDSLGTDILTISDNAATFGSALNVSGSVTATTGNYSALPASSMGLSAGDLYQTAGAVMIVL